jgi:hypothetical protein
MKTTKRKEKQRKKQGAPLVELREMWKARLARVRKQIAESDDDECGSGYLSGREDALGEIIGDVNCKISEGARGGNDKLTDAAPPSGIETQTDATGRRSRAATC